MVPHYATSIEGVGALVLSPDEKKILLVWEYGNWKPVSGAVDEGESVLYTVAREMYEEVGLKVDDTFAPVSVGGWQMAKARDARINDNFRAFVVRAASEDFMADNNEIETARWFDTTALLDAYRLAGEPSPWEKRTVLPPPEVAASLSLPDGKQKLGTNALCWLQIYSTGRGLPCTVNSEPGRGSVLIGGTSGSTGKAIPKSML